MLERAKKFINALQTEEQINIGIHIGLLEILLEKKCIALLEIDTTLFDFIKYNFDTIKKINLFSKTNEKAVYFDSTGKFLLSKYLLDIDPCVELEDLTQENEVDLTELFLKDFNVITLKKDPRQCGMIKAFQFITELKTGRQEWFDKNYPFKEISNLEKLFLVDKVDKNVAWPHKQMFNLPLYMIKAFPFETKLKEEFGDRFHLVDFFSEIAKQKIQCVVALGNAGDFKRAGTDFPAYFLNKTSYIKTDEAKKLLIKVSVDPVAHEQFGQWSEHTLSCEILSYDSQDQTITNKQNFVFKVINVPLLDCRPLVFLPEINYKFFNYLCELMRMDISIAVHCYQSKGRTGQVLATCAAIMLNKFQEFFSTENLDESARKIHEFICSIREQLTGAMLESSQMFYFVDGLYNFHLIHEEKLKEEALLKSDSEQDKKRQLEKSTNAEDCKKPKSVHIVQSLFASAETGNSSKPDLSTKPNPTNTLTFSTQVGSSE